MNHLLHILSLNQVGFYLKLIIALNYPKTKRESLDNMGNAEKIIFSVIIEGNNSLKLKMIKKEKQIIHLKEELHIIFLKRENNYTIKTKFDQYCNKFSIFETVKEVDEETVTK